MGLGKAWLLGGACWLAACADGAGQPGRDKVLGEPAHGPAVILLIGDGMGRVQVEAASRFATGAPDGLFMQSLPVRGLVRTASLSGITDSAAAATVMASGVFTNNGAIGVDDSGAPVETLLELARSRGLAVGLVTTAALPHATPGGFSAHRATRTDMLGIADDQAALLPEVMLGGGARYFAPTGSDSLRADDGLIDRFADSGFAVVRNRGQLAAAAGGERVLGLFAGEHMTYVHDRATDSGEPTLAEMSLAALDALDRKPDGFFLMIEGGRIDMAEHQNDLPRSLAETLAFDAAIAAVDAWGQARGDTTLIVTADHECGGLEIVEPAPAGVLPAVSWRWGEHTNRTVDLFARGPGTAHLDGALTDHAAVHAALAGALGAPTAQRERAIPDGYLADLERVATQAVAPSGFGAGFNQLDGLYARATDDVLAIGVAGLFQPENSLVVLIDTTGNGPALATLDDHHGRADGLLSSLNVDARADYVVIATGSELHRESLAGTAGLRGLAPATDLPWRHAALNYADGTRPRSAPLPATDAAGFEVHIRWSELGFFSAPPASVGIAAILVNGDGGFSSNQALPPFAAGTVNPGRAVTTLPGWIRVARAR